MSEFKKARDQFHAHLDTCKQCGEHPMQLCRVGAVLLKNAAIPSGEKGKAT